ncbi:MAG: hypothetical protein AMS15_02055 [Planctomycetes bacterium DG_23]|nr:MAG: hypothetical protein AMS15_02055 [Planctomycetes bacterium DG_23]
MRTYLSCIPCFVRQTVEAIKMATKSKARQKEALRKVLLKLSTASFDRPPTEIGYAVHKIIKDITKNDDPYKKVKARDNQAAMKFYSYLKELIASSDDRLLVAAKLAIAGNIIDWAASPEFDVKDTIDEVITQPLTINHFAQFRNSLDEAETILYIADNAGEIVFDKVLLEELAHKKITFLVRSEPIINDATMEDAKFASINKLAKVETVKITAKGLNTTSNRFKHFVDEADMLISKGQANYEALSDMEGPIFFLLKVKCPLIADHIQAPLGAIVLKAGGEK